MIARELNDKLNYYGMERGIRQLALKDNLATPEEVALMSSFEVCNLIVEAYDLVYSENEEIGLVKKENVFKLNELIEVISR